MIRKPLSLPFKEKKMKKTMTFLFAAVLFSASLLAACGQAAAPNGNPVPATVAPATANNSQLSGANSNPSGPDACTLLTTDDVSKVLAKPVDTTTGSGLGGVCTYIAKNLKIDFTVAGHTGGIKAMASTFASLGNLALVVPGLGDQAFYNTNSAYALFVLKGDAEYMFGMSDLTYQPLDPAFVQATEKALAVQLLSHLP
jgi:hypothetical protein